MLPHRIVTVASRSRRTASVAKQMLSQEIVWPMSPAHIPKLFFTSRANSEGMHEEHLAKDQRQPQDFHQSTDDRPTLQPEKFQRRKDRNRSLSYQERGNEKDESSKKKWRAPFWLPPPSSSSSSSSSSSAPRKRNPRHRSPKKRRSVNRFRDAKLPCRQHLDPNNSMGFPTSDWVQIFGSLPMTSLEEILDSIEIVLRKEALESDGIIDLDAEWNPHRDGASPPLVPSILDYPVNDTVCDERREYALDKDMGGNSDSSTGDDLDPTINDANDDATIEMESFRIVKAHVVLSPFGRPTGWNLKLANTSMVHALLSAAHNARVKGTLRIGWKFARVKEYHPPINGERGEPSHDPSDTRTMLVVSDSMVRFENCPPALTEDHLRHMLSRYELTPKGSTILRWKCQTSDGKIPPLTFVARFASPAYARAAVREMQGKLLEGKPMRLIQYPRQLL